MEKIKVVETPAEGIETVQNKVQSKEQKKNKKSLKVKTGNPWLNARDSWRDRYAQLANNHLWLMILTTIACLVALGCTAAAISSANRSHFVPYVIAVDDHGVAINSGFAQKMTKQSDKVVAATLAQFITATRTVTVDIPYLINNINWAYAHIRSGDPAKSQIDAWFSGDEGVENPVKRAAKELVSVKITSILKSTESTYSIEWIEKTSARNGQRLKPDMKMKAIITFEYDTLPHDDVENIVNNPLGIFVKSFSWGKKS